MFVLFDLSCETLQVTLSVRRSVHQQVHRYISPWTSNSHTHHLICHQFSFEVPFVHFLSTLLFESNDAGDIAFFS